MKYQEEQQALAEKLNAMPEQVAAKAIDTLGGFVIGFMRGYEAAKAEKEAQSA